MFVFRRSRKASRYAGSSDEDEAEVEQFIDDEWGEEDGDDQEETVFKGKANLDIMSRLSTKTTKSFIREEVEGDPFDLLSAQANRNVFSKIPKKYRQSEETSEAQLQSKKLPISGDGRIMISDLLDQIEAKDGVRSAARAQKRTRTEDDDEQSEDDSDMDDMKSARSGKSNYKPGGRGIHRAVSVSGESIGARSNRTTKSKASRKSAKSRNAPSIIRGDAYQSKNAAGDMKRRGMPDPYAYIPLNPIALNKRKALKYKGEFKAIVKGAKKGAAAGARSRKRIKTTRS